MINTFLCSPPHPRWQQLNTLASFRDSRGFVGAGNYISASHYPRNVCPDKSEGAAAVAVLVTRWTPSSISKQFPGSSSYLSLSSSSYSIWTIITKLKIHGLSKIEDAPWEHENNSENSYLHIPGLSLLPTHKTCPFPKVFLPFFQDFPPFSTSSSVLLCHYRQLLHENHGQLLDQEDVTSSPSIPPFQPSSFLLLIPIEELGSGKVAVLVRPTECGWCYWGKKTIQGSNSALRARLCYHSI